MQHLARLTDPKGAAHFVCYDAPGYTADRAKATRFTNAGAAARAGNASIYGDPAAFWNSERASAAATRARMSGWRAEIEPA